MPVLHFLNVRNGDCSIIEHGSGRVTMVDVNNARTLTDTQRLVESITQKVAASSGNFNQKAAPVNPIAYMRERAIGTLFRFILTHPDMDHMDGIADLFAEFSPPNFWDTANTCDKDADDWATAPYRKEDWEFYCQLRQSTDNPKRLVYHSGETPCDFWNADGLSILAPTPALISAANAANEWNDSSYVVMYQVKPDWKVLLCGDSHDETWEHILSAHAHNIREVDLLLAPHHGRHSDRDHSFLDVLRPKMTFFGNAPSEHLAYQEWRRRGLRVITNNQANCIVVDLSNDRGDVYVTNESFARSKLGANTFFDSEFKAWLCDFVRS